MKIPLNEFEQFIDEKILKRGLAYFKKGAVTDFTEMSKGAYVATVIGTKKYTVQLEISNNAIVTHNCDCPYDMGVVCKHVVAVIFHLEQDKLELDQPRSTMPKKKKTKSVFQQTKELLKVISHQELIDFVQEYSKKDKELRNHFLASFGYLSQNQSKVFYQKQIHSILKTAAGRKGFIWRADMKQMVNNISPFLDNVDKCLRNNSFENVFFISTALLEEMTEALQYGDDSNGDIGDFIRSAMELLSKLVQKKLPKALKEKMFEYCIAVFKKKLFKGWDWHIEILHIASAVVETEKDADTILICLATVKDEYERKEAQSIKLDLLRKFKAKKEVEKYINEHISNSLIRIKEIERYFKNKDFESVIKLSKDGISDKKDRSGSATIWYNWLLKVAQVKKDTAKIIEYARFLLIDNYYPEQDYYQILKNNIETEKWHPFLEELIKEVLPQALERWRIPDLVKKIYIKEAWWDRLLLMLKEDISLWNIQQHEQYLAEDYSAELIELYRESIITYLDQSVGRKHYEKVCRYLRRMKKLGGNDSVNDLIELFRKEYPQRRALIEELNRI